MPLKYGVPQSQALTTRLLEAAAAALRCHSSAVMRNAHSESCSLYAVYIIYQISFWKMKIIHNSCVKERSPPISAASFKFWGEVKVRRMNNALHNCSFYNFNMVILHTHALLCREVKPDLDSIVLLTLLIHKWLRNKTRRVAWVSAAP